MNLNKVFILGNLTRDPEKKVLPSGQALVSFGIATNRFFVDRNQEKKKEAEFHNIILFGRLADIASQYLKKGSLVLIEGRLRTRSWQDEKGTKYYRTEIMGERMQLGPRNIQPEVSFINEVDFNKDRNRENFINEEDIPVIEENFNFQQFEKEEEEKKIDISQIPF